MNWEHYLRDFQNQQYPTTEEIITNNASTLYKRKQFFFKDLKHSVKFIGFVVLVLTYLHDLSMLRLCVRGFLHYMLSNPFPARHLYTDESKRRMTKWLLISVFIVNAICFLLHLILGGYRQSPNGTLYLNGSLSVQFIGENLLLGRCQLLMYDMVIFGCQLVLHILTCYIVASEDLKVTPTQPQLDELMVNIYDGEDGYNGNVMVVAINLIEAITTVMSYEHAIALENYTLPNAIPMPGAYDGAV